MKGGDKCVAMQALSVAVSINGIKDNEIIEACSEPVTFAPGDTVGIIQKGTATTQAKVLEVLSDGTLMVTFAPDPRSIEIVDVYCVTKPGAVRCTEYQLYKAKLHAKTKYPGAKVSPTINGHVGICRARAELGPPT